MKKLFWIACFGIFFNIIPQENMFVFDYEKYRFPLIATGVACMVIGNQDRNTDSGKVLQLGGLIFSATWTF